MRAGRLRHRVVLEWPTITRTASGDTVTTWTPTAEVWAEVAPDSGSERFSAATDLAELVHTVKMRWRAGVTPTHRVRYGTRTFRVESVMSPDERQRELVLRCVEVLAK